MRSTWPEGRRREPSPPYPLHWHPKLYQYHLALGPLGLVAYRNEVPMTPKAYLTYALTVAAIMAWWFWRQCGL